MFQDMCSGMLDADRNIWKHAFGHATCSGGCHGACAWACQMLYGMLGSMFLGIWDVPGDDVRHVWGMFKGMAAIMLLGQGRIFQA